MADLWQVILSSFRGDPSGDEVYQRLLSLIQVERVLSAQTVLTLVNQLKHFNPDPESAIEHQRNENFPETKGKLT